MPWHMRRLKLIRKASKKMGDWRLEGCTMYVTLEPCQMCAGAIVVSRMTNVVIGSMNKKAGCAGSVLNILRCRNLIIRSMWQGGVLEMECGSMLSDFFRELRRERRENWQRTTKTVYYKNRVTVADEAHIAVLAARCRRLGPAQWEITKPCQVGNEAALRRTSRVPQGCLGRAKRTR